jgi:hypothetical protein
MWYKLASSQNSDGDEYYDKTTQQNASNQLAHLKKTMTEREIAEAEQLFSEWKPGQCEQELTPSKADY